MDTSLQNIYIFSQDSLGCSMNETFCVKNIFRLFFLSLLWSMVIKEEEKRDNLQMLNENFFSGVSPRVRQEKKYCIEFQSGKPGNIVCTHVKGNENEWDMSTQKEKSLERKSRKCVRSTFLFGFIFWHRRKEKRGKSCLIFCPCFIAKGK